MTKTDIIEVSACSGLLSKKFVCKVRRRGLRDTVGKLSGGDSHTFPEAFDEKKKTTRMGFEPTRAEHIGLAVQRLNHSATSSLM